MAARDYENETRSIAIIGPLFFMFSETHHYPPTTLPSSVTPKTRDCDTGLSWTTSPFGGGGSGMTRKDSPLPPPPPPPPPLPPPPPPRKPRTRTQRHRCFLTNGDTERLLSPLSLRRRRRSSSSNSSWREICHHQFPRASQFIFLLDS